MKERSNDYIDPEKYIEADKVIAAPTMELNAYMNEVIAKYNLTYDKAYMMLAKLAAGFGHQVKLDIFNGTKDDEVEDLFHEHICNYFALFTFYELKLETERMKKETLN